MAVKRAISPLKQRYIDENKAQGCEARTFWHAPLDLCLREIRRVYNIRKKGEMGRAYYYALLTAGLLKTWAHVYEHGEKVFPTSATQAQAWVSGILTDARRKGVLPWSAVYDDSRSSWSPHYTSLDTDLAIIGQSRVSVEMWKGQNDIVEVWTEKENAFDMLLDICRPYHVPVNSVKGFSSAYPIHRAAQRYGRGKNVYLYYIGDFDPSGLEIEESLYRELWNEGCRAFQATRLAVTPEQALLLPEIAAQELKLGDTRTKKFMAQYPGMKAFEMDAYPSDQLERDLKDAILSHIAPQPWDEAIRLQGTAREWITEKAQELIGGEARYWERGIRRKQELIDPKTGKPFPQKVIDRYLGEGDDDLDDLDEADETDETDGDD